MKKVFALALLLLISFGFATYLTNAKTLSMPSAIPEKCDRIYLENTPFENLKTGDAVCVRPDNEQLRTIQRYSQISPLAAWVSKMFSDSKFYLCHRITHVSGTFITTKGDANAYGDPLLIRKWEYYGKVSWCE